jgi:hypothetical protein
MKVELNIGLGNNPFDASGAAMLAANVLTKNGATELVFRTSQGTYEEQAEPNVIMKFEWDVEGAKAFHAMSFQDLLEALAVIMTQECIAFYVQEWSDGGLTYRTGWDGDRLDFSLEYFERF